MKSLIQLFRSLKRKHLPKHFMDFDKEIKNPLPVDNTFGRILGERKYSSFSTSAKDHGSFTHLVEKYQTKGLKEESFKTFLDSQLKLEKEKSFAHEAEMNSTRLFNTSNKNQYNSQPIENNIGRRLMKTQDAKDLQADNIDKNFMVLHKMSKFPSILKDSQVESYLDQTAPYYKDKEITFWSTNLNKGNVYRSFLKGENSFGRSSGFTQPIHNTRGVEKFSQNVNSTSYSNFNYLNEQDEKFIEKYIDSNKKKNHPVDLTQQIKIKVNRKFYESWITLRNLRKFLKNLNRKDPKSDLIDSTNFKHFLVSFGIYLDDQEIKFIFDKFDKKRNNLINFNEFLDYMSDCSDNRRDLIKKFYIQIKNKYDSNDCNVSFKILEKLLKVDLHPEVTIINKL